MRRASAADADLVAPLFDAYRQFYRQPSDLERARSYVRERLERDEAIVYLATEPAAGGERAVGFVLLYPTFSSVSTCPIWVLNDLYTAPDARGRGVGRALMEAARAHAERTGAQRIVLSTGRTNARARTLYEALGYVRDDEFDTYTLEISVTPPRPPAPTPAGTA